MIDQSGRPEQILQGGKYFRFANIVCRQAGRSSADLLALNLIVDGASRPGFAYDDKYLRRTLEAFGIDRRRVSEAIRRLMVKGLIRPGDRTDTKNPRVFHRVLRPSARLAAQHAEAIKRKRFISVYLDQLAPHFKAISKRKAGCLKDWFALMYLAKGKAVKPPITAINAVAGDRGYIRRVRYLRAAGIVAAGRSRELVINLHTQAAKRWREQQGYGVIRLPIKDYRPPPETGRPIEGMSKAQRRENRRRLAELRPELGGVA